MGARLDELAVSNPMLLTASALSRFQQMRVYAARVLNDHRLKGGGLDCDQKSHEAAEAARFCRRRSCADAETERRERLLEPGLDMADGSRWLPEKKTTPSLLRWQQKAAVGP